MIAYAAGMDRWHRARVWLLLLAIVVCVAWAWAASVVLVHVVTAGY